MVRLSFGSFIQVCSVFFELFFSFHSCFFSLYVFCFVGVINATLFPRFVKLICLRLASLCYNEPIVYFFCFTHKPSLATNLVGNLHRSFILKGLQAPSHCSQSLLPPYPKRPMEPLSCSCLRWSAASSVIPRRRCIVGFVHVDRFCKGLRESTGSKMKEWQKQGCECSSPSHFHIKLLSRDMLFRQTSKQAAIAPASWGTRQPYNQAASEPGNQAAR